MHGGAARCAGRLHVPHTHACRYTLQGVQEGHRLITRRLYVRRARELNQFSAWQARLSTAMEIGDVVAPLLTRLLSRLSRFVSWLLVSLVGGGLGLIYKGIRQSLSGSARSSGDGERRRGRRQQGGRTGEEERDPEGFFYGFG